jgi:predicted transcriptional regulator
MMDQIKSDKAKLICLYLSIEGKATVDEMKLNLDMKCMEVYSVIEELSKNEIVECVGSETYRVTDNKIKNTV